MIVPDSVTEPFSTRERIAAAADQLFYEQGFEATSFADIAGKLGLSRGNFYHHFKTKDEILLAVLGRRLESTKAMLDTWALDQALPADCLKSFARILITNRSKIMAHGCPVGTLSNELAKLDHDEMNGAAAIFGLFREWLAMQFTALGHTESADALAMHLLMRSQGIATMATAFRDEDFIDREVEAIEQWIDSIVAHDKNGSHSCS